MNSNKGPIYNDQPPQTPGPIYGNPPSYGGPTTPNAAYSPGDRYSQPFRQPQSQSMNGPGSNVAIKKMNPPETPGSALDFQAPTEWVLFFFARFHFRGLQKYHRRDKDEPSND